MLEKLKQRLTKKEKSPGKKNGRKNLMSFDLLYQLSYMSVIAASGVPRSQIFERAAQISCSSAEYFRKIELTSKRLKYDYARACRLVGETAEEEEIKGLLLRFSSSLISGEPEAEFLAREAGSQAEDYENEYGRKLETMKMWTDAYVSLILSAVLVIIIGIVSTMIWKIETGLVLGMAFIAVMTTTVGVWLIYIVSPKETMVLPWAGSKEQKIARKLFRLTLPIAVAVGALLLLMVNLGWALLAVAVLVLPAGFIMATDDRKISKRDIEMGTFLRSLGSVCGALGTTVNAGLARIDFNSINILRSAVTQLNTRLVAGIRSRLCWTKFVDETGSELANRSVGMFYDAINLGGSPGQAGEQASLFASKVALLRARRRTVASPFRWLCIAMHASIVALLVFITEVILSFAGMVAQAQAAMPTLSGTTSSVSTFSSFNVEGLELMHTLVLPLVLIFTVANAIVPSLAEGGSKYKILYNLAITAFVSGISLISLPTLADALFKSAQM